MPNPIVELVEQELVWFESVWNEDHTKPENLRIFPHRDNLYPIPFFGDIRRAEVLTMALNPAHDEFENRQWRPRAHPTALTGAVLASRLLHYFDLPEPGPHPFFRALSKMLLPIHCSYLRNAAHVDLSSLPTLKPSQMIGQREDFVGTVRNHVMRLNAVFRAASKARLLVVLDFHVNDGNGGQMSIWEELNQHCPLVAPYAGANGETLPVLKRRSVNDMTELLTSMRHEIREHLVSGDLL